MRLSRKSQKTKSDISRLVRKSSTKDKVSSIKQKSNSSIVEPSIEVKKSWNDAIATKPSSYSWTEVQPEKIFGSKTSSWGGKDSLNESSEKNNQWNALYSNYLTTGFSSTFSTPNNWGNKSGNYHHLNENISNNSRYNNSFHEYNNNQFRPYNNNSYTKYDSSWKSTRK